MTVPDYTGDLWWFVRDVNGVERTITAITSIFEQPRERTFPFDLVEPLVLMEIADENEAARTFAALNGLIPRRRERKTDTRAA